MNQKPNFKLGLATMVAFALTLSFSSCGDKTEVSAPFFQAGKPIDASTTGGAVKGTMLANTTYRISTDLVVNEGDTLVIQPGVRIYMGAADAAKNGGNSVTNLIVRGTLLSLGTKEKPIYFTVENQAKTDTPGATVTDANGIVDPAYKGIWGGILGDSKTKLMVIKWTHVEFGCGKLAASPVSGITSGNPAYMISFVNPVGVFILEDSWVYGGVDDPIRIQGGLFNVMRNTFEKGGLFGGESLNVKAGSVGNYAYNLTIGSATNGPKASNKGTNKPQANVYMYNNTILNSGYRRDKPGRGGSLNFEEGAKGLAFNNIVVNCKYGLRILTADKGSSSQYSNNPLPPADFTNPNITYGNNLYYVDNVELANQIYPIESGTGMPAGANADIPNFSTLGITLTSTFPLSKSVVTIYDGAKAVQASGTNPLFKTFTLPATKPSDIAYASGFDFNLQSGSPAIGKGFTGFPPITTLSSTDANNTTTTITLPISANFGSSSITPPNKDLGAYPMDGSGNKH